MARIRSANPCAPVDEDVATMSLAARYVWAYLPCHADRDGRLKDSPFTIKTNILPADNVDMNAILDELADRRHIIRYQIDGRRFIQIRSFHRHQSPHKREVQSIIPCPPGWLPMAPVHNPEEPGLIRVEAGALPASVSPSPSIPDPIPGPVPPLSVTRSSDLDQTPERPRSNSGAIEPPGNPGELPPGPVTSYALTRLFGKIREREVGGLPWAGVRSSGGRDATMAEEINADPNARVDVAPSMALLFRWAREGRAGPRSAQILKDPTFAFASWCTSWTALREELHGAAPKVPAAAKPPDPGLRPWQQHDKAEERRKATERSEGRVALAQLTRELADGKAVAG